MPSKKSSRPHSSGSRYKRVTCPACGKSYANKDTWKRHFRSVHTSERPHRCNLCSWRFTRPDDLKTHLKRSHGVKQSLVCDICQRSYDLEHYFGIHTCAKCEDCSMTFHRTIDLKKHMKSYKSKRKNRK